MHVFGQTSLSMHKIVMRVSETVKLSRFGTEATWGKHLSDDVSTECCRHAGSVHDCAHL
jgi:hypothetical protein